MKFMMFKLYSSVCRENSSNCSYPNSIDVVDEAALASAVSHDYVGAKYKGNYRKKENFEESNCLIMDCDNNHTDNPNEWVSISTLKRDFPEVNFAIHYSRNNMKPKDGKTARPKFHVFFPIDNVNNSDKYSAMKEQVLMIAPYFDNKAKDAARFFFGTENPKVEIISGTKNLTQFLSECQTANIGQIVQNKANVIPVSMHSEITTENLHNYSRSSEAQEVIPIGQRNNTMHDTACNLITRYGNTSEAYISFIEQSKRCQSPLSDNELQNIWNGSVNFYNNNVLTNNNYITPEIFNFTPALKPDDYSDMGEAKVIERECKNKLRFCEISTFLVYQNGCWHESEVKSQGLAQDLTDRQLEEAQNWINILQAEIKDKGIQNIIDSVKKSCAPNLLNKSQELLLNKLQQAEEYKKFVMQRRNIRFIKSALSAVKPMISVKPDELDSNEFDLNTPAGTYDLRLGLQGLRPHNPDDLITKITAVTPSDDGMDIWLDFLNTIFQGDKTLIDFVQDTIGLTAIGKVYNENIIIAYGNGCNGKSTFYNVIAHILGNYSGTISSESLTIGYRGNSKAERAEMKGKRIIIASELEEGERLNTATLKQLCSTDKIHAEKKFEAPFEFTPSHSLVLYTNHKPEVSANDSGTWRRIIVIPFKAHIESKQDIKNYSDFLFKNAGGAILKCIIEGAYKVIKKDFKLNPPDAVLDEIAYYRDNNDWFADFLEQYCELGADYSESSKKLYDTYRNYCNSCALNIHSTNDFYSVLENFQCSRFKENKGGKRTQMFRGIKLKNI